MIEGSEAELLTKDYARENYWRVVKRESGGELLVGQVMHASAPAKKRKKGAPPESGRLHIRYDDGSECDYDLDSLLDLCTEGEQALQAAVQAAEGLQVRLLRSTERLDSEIMPDEEREREFGGASLRSVEADFIVGPLRVGLKLRLDNDDREKPFRTINITANGHVHHSLFSEIYVHSPPGEPWKQHLPGMGASTTTLGPRRSATPTARRPCSFQASWAPSSTTRRRCGRDPLESAGPTSTAISREAPTSSA